MTIRRRAFLFLLVTFLLTVLSWGTGCDRTPVPSREDLPSPVPSSPPPERIVSVVPSLTETLFALGLGDRLVGVSDYCHYPPEADTLPKVGGLFNLNLERVVELRPDLVILLKDHADIERRIKKFGIKTLMVDHSSLEGIFESFGTIARLFDPETIKRGEALEKEMRDRIATVQEAVASAPPRSVLLSIDRKRGNGISNVYVAGNNPYFNEILEFAGGRNVFASAVAAVPIVSREGILETNPEVILDLSTDGDYHLTPELSDQLLAIYQNDWETLGENVTAVRTKAIYPILEDYATIPGPRSVLLVEKIARLLHPDVFESP